MAIADVNVARPAYLSWTLFRDYHYAVFNSADQLVYILVMDKGKKAAYWTDHVDPRTQLVVYENSEMQARIMAGRYITRSDDLVKLLEANHPPGHYNLSVVDASGKRLYHFSIWS